MPLRKQFGGVIRELRTARRFTQEELAERSTLSVDAIRRIERGASSSSLNTVHKLATALDVSLGTLFTTLDSGRTHHVDELCDYLGSRSQRELRLAREVLFALFGRER